MSHANGHVSTGTVRRFLNGRSYVTHCVESKTCKFTKAFEYLVVAEAMARIHTKKAAHSCAVWPVKTMGRDDARRN